MSESVIPLFPLHTVLFPGGPLPLRIFETRYTDMVRRCTREQRPFGVVLIQEGDEAGPVATTATIGCSARIADFYTLRDGRITHIHQLLDSFDLVQQVLERDVGADLTRGRGG